jgi:hypothetical protein
MIDGVLLRNSCLLLLEVNLHQPDLYILAFERELLAASRTFYAAESQALISTNPVADYMRQAESRILEEEARADRYFDKSTKTKLRTILQEELLTKYSKRLVDDPSGAVFLLKQGAVEDMGRMYSLFQRVPECLVDVREALFQLVKSTGTAIVGDKEHQRVPRLFVEKVLECRTHYMQFIDVSFKQDRQFARVLKDALEHFLNLDTRAAQYLSLYLDDLLRKQQHSSGLHLSDQELDAKLNDIMSIFRYIQDKDIFEEYYKQHLSQRLLEHTSSNAEIEKLMIAKLKAESGHQFTSRLEGMFRDMELSKEVMQTWKEGQQQTQVSSTTHDIPALTLVFEFSTEGSPSCLLSCCLFSVARWMRVVRVRAHDGLLASSARAAMHPPSRGSHRHGRVQALLHLSAQWPQAHMADRARSGRVAVHVRGREEAGARRAHVSDVHTHAIQHRRQALLRRDSDRDRHSGGRTHTTSPLTRTPASEDPAEEPSRQSVRARSSIQVQHEVRVEAVQEQDLRAQQGCGGCGRRCDCGGRRHERHRFVYRCRCVRRVRRRILLLGVHTRVRAGVTQVQRRGVARANHEESKDTRP